jgi:hypothetical protein
MGALGYLVVLDATLGFMSEWLDPGVGGGMIRVALLAGVVGYVVPSVWAHVLGQPLGRGEMKNFLEARTQPLTYLGLAIGVIVILIGVGLGVGIVIFLDAWEGGNLFVAGATGLVVGAVLLRVGIALLILVPVGLVESLRVADAVKRAWSLSRRSLGVLSVIVLVGVIIQIGGVLGVAAVFGSDWISDRTFTVVIAPLTSTVLNLWWILTGGPAYGIARKRAEGYQLAEVQNDLEQILRPSQTYE